MRILASTSITYGKYATIAIIVILNIAILIAISYIYDKGLNQIICISSYYISN